MINVPVRLENMSLFVLRSVSKNNTLRGCCCGFSTSRSSLGKKSKTPFDRRFPLSPKDVAPTKEGGKKHIAEMVGRGVGRPMMPGYLNENGEFHKVKEMEPELVVPDLTGFKLKPYVSYRMQDIVQSEFTAQDLFNACYSGNVIEDYRNGKLKDKEHYLNKKVL